MSTGEKLGNETSIRSTIERLVIGRRVAYKGITMFPLFGPVGASAEYMTLDEALAAHVAHITEVSDGGAVPELQIVNDGELPIFLLDGEELVGAKQNRTLNLSVLAPAKTKLTIPVSCVEAGRWSHVSTEFASSPRTHYATGRARKTSQVTASLREAGSREADQGAVWQDIDAKARRMASPSLTHAMAAMYERHSGSLEEYVAALSPEEGQIGAVFAIGGKIIGADLLDSPATLSKLLPKIVRSYALDALDQREETNLTAERIASEAVQEFLQSVADASTTTHPALGLGEDLRLSCRAVAAGGLIAWDRVVHLAAFTTQEEAEAPAAEAAALSRASTRRRNRMNLP